MTNSTLYYLFTFGSHTGSHLELKSYAMFAKVANIRFVQAITDISYYLIEIWHSTTVIIMTNSSSSGHPWMPNLIFSYSYFDCLIEIKSLSYKDMVSLQI